MRIKFILWNWGCHVESSFTEWIIRSRLENCNKDRIEGVKYFMELSAKDGWIWRIQIAVPPVFSSVILGTTAQSQQWRAQKLEGEEHIRSFNFLNIYCIFSKQFHLVFFGFKTGKGHDKAGPVGLWNDVIYVTLSILWPQTASIRWCTVMPASGTHTQL